jgi:predicted nuclease with TOPRIM domain
LAEDRETLIHAQQENERLLMEHDAALRQCDEIKAEAQQERKRACRLERDNARLESMINDLSKQVWGLYKLQFTYYFICFFNLFGFCVI